MNEDGARERDSGLREFRRPIVAPFAAQLFEQHADWLRRYVRHLADNRSLPPSFLDPDDVVQEAFVQLLLHDWAEPIRNPGAWLCVVVRNQVSKAAQQHRHFTGDDPAAHIEAGTTRWSSVARQASTEDIQEARAAVDAIARLGGNQQVATYLSRVQGWPHADVAAFLGCSTSAAGVHVFRGTHAVMAGVQHSGYGMKRSFVAAITRSFRRLAVIILAVLAAITVVLFISGVPWWAAVLPVIAPAGTIMVFTTVTLLGGALIDTVKGGLGDQQPLTSAEPAGSDQAAAGDAGSDSVAGTERPACAVKPGTEVEQARSFRRFRRRFAVIQVVLAAVTVVLFISGVPWWAAVLPVIAPTGAILLIVVFAALTAPGGLSAPRQALSTPAAIGALSGMRPADPDSQAVPGPCAGAAPSLRL